jgi:hypothetical protein
VCLSDEKGQVPSGKKIRVVGTWKSIPPKAGWINPFSKSAGDFIGEIDADSHGDEEQGRHVAKHEIKRSSR